MNQISSIEQAIPNNIELEQQIIGAILLDNRRYHKIGGMVRPEHFFDPVHADIWRNISARIIRDHIASPVTLKADLESHEGLKELGGPGYLARLAGGSVSGFAVSDYANDLIELAMRREVISACDSARSMVSEGRGAGEAVASLEGFIQRRDDAGTEKRSMSLLAAHLKSLTAIQEARESGVYGISTGLADFDSLIGGLRKKEFTIIAGATSMGKTTLGTWLAYRAAKDGYGVGFASLEMSEESLSQRIVSIDCQIPYVSMQRDMSENVFRKVADAAKGQEALPIEIYGDRVRDIPAILSETKRLKATWEANGSFKGLGLLVVDYVQLVRGKGSSFEVLTQVSRDLKGIAKLLDIPVIGLAQVSRDMSKRESKVPHLGDLRGSGDLENDADNVIFCHRPGYYLERMEPPEDIDDRADYEAAIAAHKGKMDLIVSKQRMGPLGTAKVGCDMGTNRFWDMHKQGEVDF